MQNEIEILHDEREGYFTARINGGEIRLDARDAENARREAEQIVVDERRALAEYRREQADWQLA